MGDESEKPTVWVIHWAWSDNSKAGLVGAFSDERSARAVMRLLAAHGDMSKVFDCEEMPLQSLPV